MSSFWVPRTSYISFELDGKSSPHFHSLHLKRWFSKVIFWRKALCIRMPNTSHIQTSGPEANKLTRPRNTCAESWCAWNSSPSKFQTLWSPKEVNVKAVVCAQRSKVQPTVKETDFDASVSSVPNYILSLELWFYVVSITWGMMW